MAEAQITKLARIVPGELSPDQAIIDYSYYDPEILVRDILSDGFFNKMSHELTLYSRITVYCLADNLGLVGPSLKRFEMQVISKEPIPYKNYDHIEILPLPGTWQTNTPGNLNVWDVRTLKYQGMVTWSPVGGAQYNDISIPNRRINFFSPDIVLFNQPNWAGESSRHLIQMARVSAPAQISIAWAPTWPAGVETYDIAPGQSVNMYIEVWSDLIL